MALDEAAMEVGRSGGVAFRAYGWSPHCVSLGRNQPTGEHLGGRPRADLNPGLDVVRRPTGGRAVFHGPELTYAVVAPQRALGGPRGIYTTVHEALARTLGSLGVSLDRVDDAHATPPLDTDECFIAPAAGEITVGDRKLVGSAQWRHRGAVLQHGSVLMSNEQSRASEDGHGGAGAVALDELGVTVSFDGLRHAIAAELGGLLGVEGAETPVPDDIAASAASIESRYGSPEWTWRR